MDNVQRRRLSGLDGLRALAVVAVLLFHADSSLLPGGFLGVDLFSVISGYLITRILLNELGETGRLDLTQFYLQRMFRLVPAVVGVVAAVNGQIVWADIFASTGLLQKYWPKLVRSYASEAVVTKAKGALGKVKVGDMVKVSYTEKDGKMNASSITMVKAPSKAPAEKTDTK